MNVGIIGAGEIGSTIARKLSAAGHNVKLSNSKGAHSIRELANSIGAEAVAKEQAVKDADVIVVAIPSANYPHLSELFESAPKNAVIIDTSNYYPLRDGIIMELDDGKTESIWVSEQVGRSVIKTWNACLAYTLAEQGKPTGSSGRIALPVAGDDPEAKRVAMQLVDATGFDAVDAGALDESWRQQPGNPAYCTELNRDDLESALALADKDQAPKNRDSLLQYFMDNYGKLSHEDIVAKNRVETSRS